MRTVIVCLAGLLLFGSVPATPAVEGLPTKIGIIDAPMPKIIRSQGRTVLIKSHPSRPARFTVKAPDGKVLAKNATLDDLQRRDPALAHFVRDVIATHRRQTAPTRVSRS